MIKYFAYHLIINLSIVRFVWFLWAGGPAASHFKCALYEDFYKDTQISLKFI